MLFSKTLSTIGSTRATAYAASNKIITAKGKVFVTWLDHVSDIRVKTYDVAAGTWGETVLVGKGVDNHGGPAMTMDSRGYLYVVFGPHHGPFQFRRSSRPYDAAKWEPVRRFGSKGTYPSLICDADDTLHCAYRGGPSPPRLMYQRRVKGGKWSKPRAIVHPNVKPGYTQYGNALAVSPDGVIHLGFHIYDYHQKIGAGKSLGYLRSRDKGKTWETIAGLVVKTPATPKTPCFIEQGPKLDMRIGNLVVDPEGRPWLTALHLEKRPRSVTLWRHDGKSWKPRELLPDVQKRLPGRQLVDATMTFDRDGTMYIACTVAKAGLKKTWWGHPSLEVVMLTSADRGRTFAVTPISTVDAKLANWFPSVERPFGPLGIAAPCLIYTHGGAGVSLKDGKGTEVVFVRLAKQ